MGRKVFREGEWYDAYTGERAQMVCRDESWKSGTSFGIAKDYAGYTCPITGRWVEGKAAHRENLKRHNCRVLERGEREHNEKRRQEDLSRACKETARELTRIMADRYDSITTR